MTEQEALALKPGDRVEARYNIDEWVLAKVIAVQVVTVDWLDSIVGRRVADKVKVGQLRNVLVRREATIPTDGKPRLYPAVIRSPRNLRNLEQRETANVFSDFLEESGFLEAAIALRKKFPLVVDAGQGGGVGTTKGDSVLQWTLNQRMTGPLSTISAFGCAPMPTPAMRNSSVN